MAAADIVLQMLVDVNPQYDARLVGSAVQLPKLGIEVRVRPLQKSVLGVFTILVARLDASDGGKHRIGVTQVGVGTDLERASGEIVAQWCLGVLPVLALWRGDHSCMVSTAAFEVPAGTFAVLLGPVAERGEHDGGEAALPSVEGYLSLLSEPLRAARLHKRLHWLECFAELSADGDIDATCRLDNRDWSAGQKLLVADAEGWQGKMPNYHSRRQFLLLVPQGGEEEPESRSLVARLFGRG